MGLPEGKLSLGTSTALAHLETTVRHRRLSLEVCPDATDLKI